MSATRATGANRDSDNADSGGAVIPESEHLQQTPHGATSNPEGQAATVEGLAAD